MLRVTAQIGILTVLAGLARADIGRDDALESVLRFTGDTQASLVATLVSRGPAAELHGPYFEVGLANDTGTHISYRVRAADGVVVSMYRVLPSDAVDSGYATDGTEKGLPIAQREAEEIARAFARRHYEGFDRRGWCALPPPTGFCQRGWEYVFTWFEVLSEANALAPWPLEVCVSGYTGSVVTYERPPDNPILAPVRPLVNRRQAVAAVLRLIGATSAPLSGGETWLQVREDVLGVQQLVWFVRPTPGPTRMPLFIVDAMTGEVLGGIGEFAVASDTAAHRPPSRATTPRIRFGGLAGKGLASFVPPALRGEVLWLRAEHLRAVEGVRVDVDRNRLTVRSGDRTVSGQDLGAEWRDCGWWVPLRRAATALGWRVDWNNAKKEAVILAVR